MLNLNEYITKHFQWKEMFHSDYALRHGINNICEDETILNNIRRVAEALEIVRFSYNLPLIILSCYRSLRVNIGVGGSRSSAHKQGLAVDFRIPGIPVSVVCKNIPAVLKDYDQIIYEFGELGWCHLGLCNSTPRNEILTARKVKGKTVYELGINE